MPDLATLPLWLWWVVGGVFGAIVLALIVWFAWGSRAFTRRALVVLIGKQESVRASRRTFEAVMRHLADESDEALAEFALNAGSEDRRSLVEVRDRMWVVRDELDLRPVPGRLVHVAEELADAAYVIGEQAGLIADDMDADAVLSALTHIDMNAITAQFREAVRVLEEACADYGVEEAAVYGGGLYI